MYDRVDPLVEKMKDIPEGSLVSYEPDTITLNFGIYQIDGMLAAQSCNLVSINGYTMTSPKGYAWFWRKLDAESARFGLILRGWGRIRYT